MRLVNLGVAVSILAIAASLSASSISHALTLIVGRWQFDDSSQGLSTLDTSGSNNSAVPHGSSGGPALSTDVPTTSYTNTKSANFNGTDQYYSVDPTPALSFSQSMTITTWVKPASDNGVLQFLRIESPSADEGIEMGLTIDYKSTPVGCDPDFDDPCDTFTVRALYCNAFIDGLWTGVHSRISVPAGTWTNVGCKYDGDHLVLYINGAEDNSISASGSLPLGNMQMTIGRHPSGANPYDGLLDDLQVFSNALTISQITNVSTLGIADPALPSPTPTMTDVPLAPDTGVGPKVQSSLLEALLAVSVLSIFVFLILSTIYLVIVRKS